MRSPPLPSSLHAVFACLFGLVVLGPQPALAAKAAKPPKPPPAKPVPAKLPSADLAVDGKKLTISALA